MSDRADPPSRRRRTGVRLAAIAVALTLALIAVFDFRTWLRRRAELSALLAIGGTAARGPEMARDVEREPDRVRAALRAARGLLADELDRSWQAELDPGALAVARDEGLIKLERAREIAAAALVVRPASWQAAQVLGATRYLDALRRRLPMSPELRRSWRQPLVIAAELGPGQAEPVRFLAAATLSEWSRLSTDERAEAIPLLRRAFADPATFDLLVASWLRLSPSREVAFSVVPAAPLAWDTVKAFYARRGDWGHFALAHERQRDALYDRLAARLREARRRLESGDSRRARWYALEVLEKAPPSLRFQPLVAGALQILPPGPLGEVRRRRLSAWLAWSLERCLLGECPFEESLLARMGGLARPTEPAALAAAAEMGGDRRAAELHARGAEDLTLPWAPYHLLRARRLLRSGDPAAARRSLERVHATWRSRAAFVELAALTREEEPAVAAHRPRRDAWPAAAWIGDGPTFLELYADAACAELEVEVLGVPAAGSVVEVSWDGDVAGTHAVGADRPLRLPLAVKPTAAHRLGLDPLVHPQIRPGRVRLSDCRA